MGTMAKPAVYFLSESGLESSECCGLAQFVSDGHASATTKNQEGRLIYIYIYLSTDPKDISGTNRLKLSSISILGCLPSGVIKHD